MLYFSGIKASLSLPGSEGDCNNYGKQYCWKTRAASFFHGDKESSCHWKPQGRSQQLLICYFVLRRKVPPAHSQVLSFQTPLVVTALEWDQENGLLHENNFSAWDVAPKLLWQVLPNVRL